MGQNSLGLLRRGAKQWSRPKLGLLYAATTLISVLGSHCLMAASFDCRKATSNAEIRICSDTPPLFQPSPKTDTRGFVDVWQLRHDVAAIEPLEATDETDSCYREGDPDSPPTEAQKRREDRAEAACVAKVQANYAAYQKVWKAFNAAWLPVMREAIKRGDRVAEVIMRQCDTTPVVDRTGIESTCDRAEPRSAFARERLKKIGFVPAFDFRSELGREQGPDAIPHAQEVNQAVILNRVRSGALAFDAIPQGDIANNPRELQTSMLWAVIEAATEDAPQAFTFGIGLAKSRGAAFDSCHSPA